MSLVIIAKGQYPIPFRTRKSSLSAPMVLCLKTRESRTLPGINKEKYENCKFTKIFKKKRYKFQVGEKKGKSLYN